MLANVSPSGAVIEFVLIGLRWKDSFQLQINGMNKRVPGRRRRKIENRSKEDVHLEVGVHGVLAKQVAGQDLLCVSRETPVMPATRMRCIYRVEN
jgi:hypothetical protein